MVTLTAHQLIALSSSLLEFQAQKMLPSDAIDFMLVRISDPHADGQLEFDIYLPPFYRKSPC